LEKHGSEVLNMLFTEWNQDDAIAVAREEALEDGIEIGMEEGMERGMERGMEKGIEKVLTYLKQGHTITEAEALLRG
jgi:flagellar biosynthesis/type III secretory pathway protein FliH